MEQDKIFADINQEWEKLSEDHEKNGVLFQGGFKCFP